MSLSLLGIAAGSAGRPGGDADYVTDDVPSVLGRPARSFEQLATDYAAVFS
jgi:hypothetical protein